MPELPEVETIRIGLNRLLVGQTIRSLKKLNSKSFQSAATDCERFLVGAKVRSIDRRAKILIVKLSTGYSLLFHLKMTGQLVFARDNIRFGAGHPNDSLVNHLPDNSTRLIFELAGGGNLFFNDQRKFGWVKLVPTAEISNLEFFKKVGPEPLERNFTAELLQQRLKRRAGTSVKAALLDQSVLAGLGNIYVDESLWGARIHPKTVVGRLRRQQIAALRDAIVSVLSMSIEKGGSTDRNYVNAEGKKGSYLEFANVFRRQGSACPRCGQTIVKIKVAGRGTHLCPFCQKLFD